jgi:hypothetical protein
MRLIADISRTADGHLEGVIRTELRGEPISFSGVLELLRVLEDEIPPNTGASQLLGTDENADTSV